MGDRQLFRTERGTYALPSAYIPEAKGGYYFRGTRMGLGENRKSPLAVEVEGTYRMLRLLWKGSALDAR